MKKTLLFTSMVAMLFAFGCSKEMDNPNAETIPGRGTKVTIGASLEFPEGVSTKSTLNSTTGAFAWTQNSSERIWVQTSNGFQTLSWTSAGANPDLANFTGLITGSLVNDGKGVFPVYYASNGITPLNKPSLSGSDLTITLPSEIAWVSGEANNVMVGDLSTGTVGFQNVGGMFMVTIGNMPSDARKITFTTGKRISGDFAVTTDSNGYYIINTDETNTNGVTFTFTSEQIASEMVFYVPAPIGEYAGLAFQVKDADNNVLASFNGSTSKIITRKKLIILPMLSFASVGGNGENGTGNLVIPANYTTEENHGVFLLPSTTSDLEVLIYENSNVTIRYSEGDKPANVALIAQNAIETLNIELPESHVTLNGANTSSNVTINNVEATTSTSTFVVGAGIQIGSGQENQGLTIKGGSLTLGAPVDGTVKVNIPATNANTTDEKVNIVINSAITNLEVNTAATQYAPDKVWVSINTGASVTDAIAVPEVNCNLYIAAGASAATVATSATNTTIEGAVGELSAYGEGTTVVVEKSGSVTTSIAANDKAAIVIEERTEEEVAAGQAGAIASDQSELTGGSIDIIPSDAVAIIGSTGYNTLQAAINAATSGQTITIVKSFTSAESNQLSVVSNTNDFGAVIEKSLTIDGKGYTITGPASKRPLGIAGDGITVTLKDLTVVNNGSNGPTIWTVGPMTLNLDNTTIDGTHCSGTYNQPITISSDSSLPGRYTLNVTNGSVVKTNDDATAHYAVIVWGPADINVSNSTLKGYAAVYVKPDATGSVVTVSNCDVDSHGYSGISNAFGMFVTESNNNTFTLTSNNYTITAGDQYQVLTEMNGTTGNVVKLLGTSSFTPNDPVHGTLTNSWVKYYVNSLYMDDDNKALFADYISSECSVVKVTEGTYSGLWKVTGPTPEIYYYWDTTSGQQGTYCDLAKPFDNKWLCDGEYIAINKNLALTKTIACQLTSGSFSMNFGEYTVTKGEYSITLMDGVSVVTDKATDIFTAVSASSTIVETVGANTYTYTATPPVAQIGTTTYSTLEAAVAAAESDDTIVILSDFTVEGNAGVTIPAGKNITIDLNGKTIKNLVNADANSQLIVNRGTLTITDSSAGANGTMTNEIASGVHTGAWTNYNYYTNIISNFGTLTINAGNLTQVATTNISYVIDNLGANSSVTINGGSLMAGYIPIRAYNATNSVTIHGGSLSGLFDLYLQLTTTLVIDGGTFSAPTRSIIYVDAASNISISGNPVFTNGTDRKFIAFDTDAVKDASTLSVTGGTYNTDPSAYVAAGYEAVQSGNNWNVVELQGVAQIGSTKYTTLADAVAAVQNGQTITLLSDVTLSENPFVVNLEDKNVVLDLGGKTLSGRTNLTSGSLTIQNGNVVCDEGQPLNVYGKATSAQNYSVLTVASNVTVTGKYGVCVFGPTGSSKPGYGAVVNIAGTINAKNPVFVSGNLGNNIAEDMNNIVNINSGANLTSSTDVAVALNGWATVNVNSGAHITGSTGIAVKRGILNVFAGATVAANGQWTTPPAANNNGTEPTGAAVSMTPTYSQYGAMAINITGGDFSSANGQALYKSEGTYASDATFTVTGGTFSSDPSTYVAAGYSATDNGNGTWTVSQSAIEGTGEGGSGFEPGPSIF